MMNGRTSSLSSGAHQSVLDWLQSQDDSRMPEDDSHMSEDETESHDRRDLEGWWEAAPPAMLAPPAAAADDDVDSDVIHKVKQWNCRTAAAWGAERVQGETQHNNINNSISGSNSVNNQYNSTSDLYAELQRRKMNHKRSSRASAKGKNSKPTGAETNGEATPQSANDVLLKHLMKHKKANKARRWSESEESDEEEMDSRGGGGSGDCVEVNGSPGKSKEGEEEVEDFDEAEESPRRSNPAAGDVDIPNPWEEFEDHIKGIATDGMFFQQKLLPKKRSTTHDDIMQEMQEEAKQRRARQQGVKQAIRFGIRFGLTPAAPKPEDGEEEDGKTAGESEGEQGKAGLLQRKMSRGWKMLNMNFQEDQLDKKSTAKIGGWNLVTKTVIEQTDQEKARQNLYEKYIYSEKPWYEGLQVVPDFLKEKPKRDSSRGMFGNRPKTAVAVMNHGEASGQTHQCHLHRPRTAVGTLRSPKQQSSVSSILTTTETVSLHKHAHSRQRRVTIVTDQDSVSSINSCNRASGRHAMPKRPKSCIM